jgi:hypothetical protein
MELDALVFIMLAFGAVLMLWAFFRLKSGCSCEVCHQVVHVAPGTPRVLPMPRVLPTPSIPVTPEVPKLQGGVIRLSDYPSGYALTAIGSSVGIRPYVPNTASQWWAYDINKGYIISPATGQVVTANSTAGASTINLAPISDARASEQKWSYDALNKTIYLQANHNMMLSIQQGTAEDSGAQVWLWPAPSATGNHNQHWNFLE